MADFRDGECEFPSFDECTCSCHKFPGVKHFTACCDGLPIDFWDSVDEELELFGSAESSKPKGRSATYEPPGDWLSFVNDKKTGKPLRGPGSEAIIDD
jgi:hypothetical protein